MGKSPPRHLVLIGLSYSGKSTVGALAAARLSLPLVDTDQEVERRAGTSVPELFAERGEAAFRALEREVVGVAVAGAPSVIATGGGAPLDAANRRVLWEGNLVVYLEAEAETVAARLRTSPDGTLRPLLAGPDPLSRVQALKHQREPIYRQAHCVIRTDGQSPETIAAFVCQEFLKRGRS
ncbi:MAG: shikimate kinase [Chloroflexi bacterium]|nr:shikimate kinase [Chloroflexota bacterium]